MQYTQTKEKLNIDSTTDVFESLINENVGWTDSFSDGMTGDTHFYQNDKLIASHIRKDKKLIIFLV